MKRIIPYIISLAAIAIFIHYIWKNADKFQGLFRFTWITLAGMVVLAFATIILNGLINNALYRGLGLKIGLNESVGVAAINSLANQLPFPSGGLIAVGVYLKKRFALGYARYLSATVTIYILFVSVYGLIGLMVLAVWAFQSITIPLPVLMGFGGMTAAILVLAIPVRLHFLPEGLQKLLNQAFEGWHIIRGNRVLIVRMLIYQFISLMVYALELYISFKAFSQPVTISQCMLFAGANILTQLISFTPDALGIREAVIGGLAALLGFDLTVSVMAVGLARLVILPTVIFMGMIYTFILNKKFKPAILSSMSDSKENKTIRK